MAFLLHLLSQRQPNFQARQALVVLGLQNDFISPDGKLPVDTSNGFLTRIKQLVPTFREHGLVIWVRSEYESNRVVNDPSGSGCAVILAQDTHDSDTDQDDVQGHANVGQRPTPRFAASSNTSTSSRFKKLLQRAMARTRDLDLNGDDHVQAREAADPELFLTQSAEKEACCVPGSSGAEYRPDILGLQNPADLQIVKTYYSAFNSTSLLLSLRAKLITDVYFVGCNTNLSVYATAMDAARHGLSINLVEDCLGFRNRKRHEDSLKQMTDQMGASILSSGTLLARLRGEQTENGSLEELSSSEDDPLCRGLYPHSLQSEIHPFGASVVRPDPPDLEMHQATEDEGLSSNGVQHRPDQPVDPDVVYESTQQRPSPPRILHAQSQPNTSSPRPDMPVPDPSEASEYAFSHTANRYAPSSLDGFRNANGKRPCLEFEAPHTDGQDEGQLSENVLSAPPLSTTPSRINKRRKRIHNLATFHTLGPDDAIGAGDTSIRHDLLPEPDKVFRTLLTEVNWQRMYHANGQVPRLVCCQGDISELDGSMPVYRHPSDQSLPLLAWSPTVAQIKRAAEAHVNHQFNHVLIQLYRGGHDFISEHSDKTLDIVPGSKIANISFGAQRTMRLRAKRRQVPRKVAQAASSAPSIPQNENNLTAQPFSTRDTQRIHLPHNSIFIMGLNTNATYLHGIQPDRRPLSERSVTELSFNSIRISLTFRQIGTFLSQDSRYIWGQGARAKRKAEANETINCDQTSSEEMIKAFGIENQTAEGFDWDAIYGRGFDVLNLKKSLSGAEMFVNRIVQDASVKQLLQDLGISAKESTALFCGG